MDEVISAVAYLHGEKILHRDIKPENIVMSLGVPKLCDFGWAAFDDTLMHHTFCGTLDYVSPEMKDLGRYNHSIDIWSIGVLTFELLAGFPPFKQEISSWKLKGAKRGTKWSWDVLYPPQIEGQAKEFIEGILQVDPLQRMTLSACKSHSFLTSHQQHTQSEEDFSYLF